MAATVGLARPLESSLADSTLAKVQLIQNVQSRCLRIIALRVDVSFFSLPSPLVLQPRLARNGE